jgi:hypothetical protein
MKKVLLFAILACMFVSCSSDGSREIQIDEITYTPSSDFIKPNEIEKVSSIFEVVPGKYELAWEKIQDVPQVQNYNVSLKLKLRLKRTVRFTDKFLEETKNTDIWFMWFKFCILDADGKEDPNLDVSEFYFGYKGCTNDGTMFDKDEYMDFINFLQSKPGTEKEFELNSFGIKTSVDGVDCIETCKNAKSVVCKIDKRDRDFEREIGVIE